MIWIWLVVGALIVWSITNNEDNPKNKIKRSEQLFELTEKYFNKVQNILKQKIQNPDEPIIIEDLIIFYKTQYECNDLWRKHVVFVMSSDTSSADAKLKVSEGWFDLMAKESSLSEAINIGYLDSEGMDDLMRERDLALNTFEGVMEPHGFNPRKEFKAAESKYKKEFNKSRKSKRKTEKG